MVKTVEIEVGDWTDKLVSDELISAYSNLSNEYSNRLKDSDQIAFFLVDRENDLFEIRKHLDALEVIIPYFKVEA